MSTPQTVNGMLGLLIGCVLVPFVLRADEPAARTRAHEQSQSGDPATLNPNEIRDIWQTLRVTTYDGAKPTGKAADSRFVNGLDTHMSLQQVEMFRELGLRGWAIDFSGGPFVCWLEIDETGQHTMPRREPLGDQPEIKGAFWTCDAEEGRLLFWFLPGAAANNPSERSRRIMERLEAFAPSARAIPEVFGLQVVDGSRINHQMYGEPDKPALWSSWSEVSIRELAKAAPAKLSSEVLLLKVEATEVVRDDKVQPRRVQLTLRAKPKSK